MTICAILLHLTKALAPLPLLLPAKQTLKFLNEHPILLFHLPQLKLPAGASRCLEFVENVVFGSEGFVLVSDAQPGAGLTGDATIMRIGLLLECLRCGW